MGIQSFLLGSSEEVVKQHDVWSACAGPSRHGADHKHRAAGRRDVCRRGGGCELLGADGAGGGGPGDPPWVGRAAAERQAGDAGSSQPRGEIWMPGPHRSDATIKYYRVCITRAIAAALSMRPIQTPHHRLLLLVSAQGNEKRSEVRQWRSKRVKLVGSSYFNLLLQRPADKTASEMAV